MTIFTNSLHRSSDFGEANKKLTATDRKSTNVPKVSNPNRESEHYFN